MEWQSAPRQNELALAYQTGRTEVLSELMEALSPIVSWCIQGLYRRISRLPVVLSSEDVRQEAWIITAKLVQKWDAEQGDVGGYVKIGLSWGLWRWLLHYSSSRSPYIKVSSIPHDIITDSAYGSVEVEEGFSRVIANDMLSKLEPAAREIVYLHAIEGQSLATIAQSRGWSVTKAFRLYHTGLAVLRISQPETKRELTEFLTYLYGYGNKVPGRASGRHALGLSEFQYYLRLTQLQAAGLLTPPRPRAAGQLVQPTLTAALAELDKFA